MFCFESLNLVVFIVSNFTNFSIYIKAALKAESEYTKIFETIVINFQYNADLFKQLVAPI